MEAFATFVYANFVRLLCFHCSDVLSLTSSEVLPPGVFLRISPFLQQGGMPLEGLGMPFCASRGFSSPSARLGPAGGVGGVSVRASLLLSPRFIRGLRRLELLSCGELLLIFLYDWLSLLISVRLTR